MFNAFKEFLWCFVVGVLENLKRPGKGRSNVTHVVVWPFQVAGNVSLEVSDVSNV